MSSHKKSLREFRKKLPFYHSVRNRLVHWRGARELAAWEAAGRPVPPPHVVKQRTLRRFAKEYGLKVLVETGTFRGDMVEALKYDFDRIYTIEISERLYEEAKARFRRDTHVTLLLGDSGREIANIMPALHRPALFWLDGHYSGSNTGQGEKDTPIFDELGHILGAADHGHVMIIDDARCFGINDGYPSVKALEQFIHERRPGMRIEVRDDSIRVTPQSDTAR